MTEIQCVTTVGFLIFPGFPMSCLTSMIEPLRAANEIAGTGTFVWKILSEDGKRVDSSASVGFDPDLSLQNHGSLDYLFLLSGPMANFQDLRRSNGHLRRLARHGVKMGAVSGGVFPLARSGLLDGHECSVHWCYEAAFAAEFPHLIKSDDVIVIDGEFFTASGAAAAFDLMLHSIEERLGDKITTEVACWFQHPLVRGRGVRQKIPTFRRETTADMLPDVVARAVAAFARSISEPTSVESVAQEVGVSSRQLERQFKAATGQSPSHYYRIMRMNAARQLVLYSRDSMLQIAHAVGYETAEPLLQRYQEVFGISPQEERSKINMFRVEGNRPLPSI